MAFTLNVNGTSYTVDVEPETPLLWVLRDSIGLTGTKYGCGIAKCGACTVLLNGEAVRSCLMLAVQTDGANIETVEGLAPDGELTSLQLAFQQNHALQCGFCTPGLLMTATAFLRETPNPTEEQIKDAISGNICRCTGYHSIIQAIKDVSQS